MRGIALPGGRCLPALLLAGALAPGPAAAQVTGRSLAAPAHPLAVVARRDLRFGSVFRSRPTVVSPLDHRAAAFEITTGPQADLLVNFLLPDALRSAHGDALPLAFGAGDALLTREGPHGATAQRFDPTRPLSAGLVEGERVVVSLGGAARPTVTQPLGDYRGTIVLVVAAVGT